MKNRFKKNKQKKKLDTFTEADVALQLPSAYFLDHPISYGQFTKLVGGQDMTLSFLI